MTAKIEEIAAAPATAPGFVSLTLVAMPVSVAMVMSCADAQELTDKLRWAIGEARRRGMPGRAGRPVCTRCNHDTAECTCAFCADEKGFCSHCGATDGKCGCCRVCGAPKDACTCDEHESLIYY